MQQTSTLVTVIKYDVLFRAKMTVLALITPPHHGIVVSQDGAFSSVKNVLALSAVKAGLNNYQFGFIV